MLSCHLCLLISCYSLVCLILSFDCSFCLIVWYLYLLPCYPLNSLHIFGICHIYDIFSFLTFWPAGTFLTDNKLALGDYVDDCAKWLKWKVVGVTHNLGFLAFEIDCREHRQNCDRGEIPIWCNMFRHHRLIQHPSPPKPTTMKNN